MAKAQKQDKGATVLEFDTEAIKLREQEVARESDAEHTTRHHGREPTN